MLEGDLLVDGGRTVDRDMRFMENILTQVSPDSTMEPFLSKTFGPKIDSNGCQVLTHGLVCSACQGAVPKLPCEARHLSQRQTGRAGGPVRRAMEPIQKTPWIVLLETGSISSSNLWETQSEGGHLFKWTFGRA